MTRLLLRRLTLALTLAVGGAFVSSACFARPAVERDAATACKKKRRKRAKKITAKTIKRWQKKGLSNKKIVAKAKKRGYRVTKKERKRLKRLRVRKSLRKALIAMTVATDAQAKAAAGPQPIDIDRTIDPNDIDFDSVPPPEGMDMQFADSHRNKRKK